MPKRVLMSDATLHVDAEVLYKIREMAEPNDGAEFLDDLILTYLEDLESMVPVLQSQASLPCCKGMTFIAHRLKGSSRQIGAHCFSNLFAKLEEAGKSGRKMDFGVLINAIEVEFLEVKRELKGTWLTKKPSLKK